MKIYRALSVDLTQYSIHILEKVDRCTHKKKKKKQVDRCKFMNSLCHILSTTEVQNLYFGTASFLLEIREQFLLKAVMQSPKKLGLKRKGCMI